VETLKLAARIMDYTWAYRLWQAPFSEKKLAPVLAHNDLGAVRRVLDVGCGPATNIHHFNSADYLGIDSNESYIDYARRRWGRNFVVADITNYSVVGERYDFILVNSFLHHIDTGATHRILSHLGTLLADDGCVHILELVLPSNPSISRLLARLDRGDFPRLLTDWHDLFAEHFEPVVFEPYPLGAFGLTLWNMVYFKGRMRAHN
jgi:SAM-dependent methyltransferase